MYGFLATGIKKNVAVKCSGGSTVVKNGELNVYKAAS